MGIGYVGIHRHNELKKTIPTDILERIKYNSSDMTQYGGKICDSYDKKTVKRINCSLTLKNILIDWHSSNSITEATSKQKDEILEEDIFPGTRQF